MSSPNSQIVTALALEAQPPMISVPFSGWINLLNGLAMTNDKSLPELIANSVDAQSPIFKIYINKEAKIIEFIDHGQGITMFNMIRKVLVPLSENKADQMSIGRFGLGMVAALNHLSNGQPVTIMSKHTDGDYIKVILDFNPRSMYDPTPVIMEMDERTSFTSKVPETGTIITIAYNDDIIQSIILI